MRITGLCLGLAIFACGFAALAAGGPATAPATAPASAPASTRPSMPPAATRPVFEPFTNLPPPPAATHPAAANRAQVHPGTDGLALPAPGAAAGGRTTLAILGDLAPGDVSERETYLRMAVSEIALLHPDAVLTTGNLIPGLTRNGADYVQQLLHVRSLLDPLPMPWYPCVGVDEILGGTRDPADHRFQDLYQRYAGPLYFSADIGGADAPGGIHAIVLNCPDAQGIGEAQLQWLRNDLNQTFDLARVQGVVLLLGRPLWQDARSNWSRVENLLVEFNRRPMVSFEGTPMARGPRVLAVLAGGRRAYDQEPPREGIRYLVLGPTAAAARAGQEDEAPRHFTLLTCDGAGELHIALVRLGGNDPAAPQILPEDFVTDRQRAILDAVADWNDTAFAIEGVVDERGAPLSSSRALTAHFRNPLDEAFDVQLRMSPEGNWDFSGPPPQRHLTAAAGAAPAASAEFSLRRLRAGTDLPVVQAVVRWTDTRARVHAIVLRRTIAVAPSIDLNVAEKPIPLLDAAGWAGAPGGIAVPWTQESDRPRKADPTIAVRADADRLLVQVHVADATPSYWPMPQLDPVAGGWGGLPSDAVSLAWARDDHRVQRVWVLPYAPPPVPTSAAARGTAATAPTAPFAPELWINTGLGDGQTPLQKIDPKLGAQASITLEAGGYSIVFSLPRKLVCDEIPEPPPGLALPLLTPQPPASRIAATALLNLAVHDNDQTARTWTKGWALEEAGPDAWARIQLIQPTSPQPGIHLP